MESCKSAEIELSDHFADAVKMVEIGSNAVRDVVGGFGDAIPQEEVICGFDNREDANRFVEKYSNPHIYDSPYASLECGVLRVEELNMTQPDREDMWWLD